MYAAFDSIVSVESSWIVLVTVVLVVAVTLAIARGRRPWPRVARLLAAALACASGAVAIIAFVIAASAPSKLADADLVPVGVLVAATACGAAVEWALHEQALARATRKVTLDVLWWGWPVVSVVLCAGALLAVAWTIWPGRLIVGVSAIAAVGVLLSLWLRVRWRFASASYAALATVLTLFVASHLVAPALTLAKIMVVVGVGACAVTVTLPGVLVETGLVAERPRSPSPDLSRVGMWRQRLPHFRFLTPLLLIAPAEILADYTGVRWALVAAGATLLALAIGFGLRLRNQSVARATDPQPDDHAVYVRQVREAIILNVSGRIGWTGWKPAPGYKLIAESHGQTLIIRPVRASGRP